MIPYGKQDITEDDIEAVISVLKSDFLTQGPAVPAFEHAVTRYCGAKYAVAVNSATSALHIACLALGLGPGDLLWTSPITFVATANCARYCGAEVDFVDIDPLTFNMSVEALSHKLASAEKEGNLPTVVIPVHMAGQSCDMKTIWELAQRYGFRVIEDASHAVGARYLDEPVGRCNYSDITVFSFHPVKIITSAEGGMALTNDAHLAERMMLLRSHGITRDPALMKSESEGLWYYQQIDLGLNYRLTDLQAALGLSQMDRLDGYVQRRHELADRYDSLLTNLPTSMPWRSPNAYSAFHLYIIRLKLGELNVGRREVFEMLRAADIGVNVHYIPVHTQPYYRALGFKTGEFPQAEKYYREAISIPLYPTMTEHQQDGVISALKSALLP